MNSRNKRKLAYRAKNEKGATVRNLTLADNIRVNYNNVEYNNKQKDYNDAIAKKMRLSNSLHLNKNDVSDVVKDLGFDAVLIKGRKGHMTKKYANNCQRLRKARKSA